MHAGARRVVQQADSLHQAAGEVQLQQGQRQRRAGGRGRGQGGEVPRAQQRPGHDCVPSRPKSVKMGKPGLHGIGTNRRGGLTLHSACTSQHHGHP